MRDAADRRFYHTKFWEKVLRPQALRAYPLCEHCLMIGRVEPARQVDHILRPQGNTDLQRMFENLQSLCVDHHQRKSAWERYSACYPLDIGTMYSGYTIRLRHGCSDDKWNTLQAAIKSLNQNQNPGGAEKDQKSPDQRTGVGPTK
jgi:hypothetical protein